LPGRKLYNVGRFRQLLDFLRREKFDVLQAHLSHAILLGALAGRWLNLPVAATLHSTGVEPRYYNPVWWCAEMLTLRYNVKRVVAVGQSVADAHHRWLGRRPIEVIPNAVELPKPLSPSEREAARREMVGDPTRLILISVGRLAVPKGYPDLLTAFARVQQTFPRAALVIAGDGPLRAELESQIQSLGLTGQVFLLGTRGDVPRLLAASDVYASASHWEGLPVAVLEAMAAGLPVAATQVGDVALVIPPGTGLVVPAHQPAQLADALLNFLQNPDQMQLTGAAARAHVVAHYSPSVWLDKLLALYSEMQVK
jgi:glycosyltransferase involved in cell wall biosynthesis